MHKFYVKNFFTRLQRFLNICTKASGSPLLVTVRVHFLTCWRDLSDTLER